MKMRVRPKLPDAVSINPSVNSCRTIRPGPAPNDRRTAISRRRAVFCARIMFATLPQAISSTSETSTNGNPIARGRSSFRTASIRPPMSSRIRGS